MSVVTTMIIVKIRLNNKNKKEEEKEEEEMELFCIVQLWLPIMLKEVLLEKNR